jgi:hypothetical protein
MSFDGSGTFTLAEAAFVYDTVISETAMNSNLSDIATGLTTVITKTGVTTPTANLPMGGYKHTGVGAGTARTDYADVGSVGDGDYIWCGTAGGSANAITMSGGVTFTAYVTGMELRWKASSNANTGAATINVNSIAAKALQINDSALAAGDHAANKYYRGIYDGTAFQIEKISAAVTAGDVVGPGSATDNSLAKFDGTTGKLLKNGAVIGTDVLATVVQDSSPQLGGFLDANGNYIQSEKGGDISSASPLVIDTDGDYFDVTGTTNFAAMTVAADRRFTLQFDGVLTMTHHATNIDLPGGANITTAAGDVGVFQSTGANTVQCVSYTKADGTSVVAAASGFTLGTPVATTSGSQALFGSIPAGTKVIHISFAGASTNGTAAWNVTIGDAGGLETSGYTGSETDFDATTVKTPVRSTSNFPIFGITAAASLYHGTVILTLENASAFTWTMQGLLTEDQPIRSFSAGSKSLSAELTQVAVNTTDTFDAGAINITYSG